MSDDPTDAVWKRDEVQSPCNKVCMIHPESRLCVGCYRTIDEIGLWSRMSNAERADVIADLPGRASRVPGRRRARQRRAARSGDS